MNLTISIPQNSTCLLRIGQEVDFDKPFFEGKKSSDVLIPISKKLGIQPSKIFNYLKKFVGDTIQKGDILAEKKGMLNNKKLVSEHAGVIREVNHNDGSILLTSFTDVESQFKTYFKGEVAEIKKDQLTLKVNEAHEFNIKNANDNFGGEILFMKTSDQPMSALELTNKIMLIESLTPYLRTKSEALGVKGFISLKNPPESGIHFHAQVKQMEDFYKIMDLDFPYCVVDKQYSKIYVYK